jgi:polyribonucleotide nucleotidyltransferase
VPILAPVAGISIGWVAGENDQHVLLTDIQGIEDHHGDMDFKVAGTTTGVTAVQLDLKARGLPSKLIPEIFARAREARLFILEKMNAAIADVRPELSQFAPRVLKTSIPSDRIGQLIGPGGKNIRAIQDQHKVKIDVEEDGTVFIAGVDGPAAERAMQAVDAIGKDVEIGQTYMGKVVRITNFGAFVEILPGKDGLVRMGELSDERVNRVEDAVSMGDEIMVKVIEIDPQGRVNLSRRAVLAGDDYVPAERPPRGEGGGGFRDREGGGGGGFGRGPRRDGGGGGGFGRGPRPGGGGGFREGGFRDRPAGPPREEQSPSGEDAPAPSRPRTFRSPPPGFGSSD